MGEITTADGATVRKGDRVFNYYDWQWGTIIEDPDSEGWFYVEHEDGSRKTLNGERIAVSEPRR